jgi:SAM-dependent methyltransferase
MTGNPWDGLEETYLQAADPRGGSGFRGDDARWARGRRVIVEAIDRDGSFLDVGCANGLLMESVVTWCAERGVPVEPYGVDLSPGLVDLARRRLPQWADRIWVGNAIDWVPPGGQRFDYVHVLLGCVPTVRRASLIRHHLDRTVRRTGGRLLVSDYAADPARGTPEAAETVRALGFPCAGQSSGDQRTRSGARTAWIDA